LLQRRSQPVALMQAFDAPVMVTNCEARMSSTVATQSLMLMNGEFWLSQAAALADRALREPTNGLPVDLIADLPRRWEATPLSLESIARAWQLAYSRLPSREELQLACDFLTTQRKHKRVHPLQMAAGRSPETQALTNLCHALLSSNEFLYLD
jgi:hypothetical protein